MQVEYESVKSLLLALTKFPVADIAKCPLNLIEKAGHLIERARRQSVPTPSPLRPQDEEGLTPGAVTSSPPRPRGEEELTPATVPSSPPRPRDEEGLASGPVGTDTAAVETNAKKVVKALLEAIKETNGLLKQGVKDVIRGDLSPAAYHPCVQDLEACTRNQSSNAQKLRHIIVLPRWLKAYEDFCPHFSGRRKLVAFSQQSGLKYETAREGLFRAKRLRHIAKCYGNTGLEAPLGLIMWKWRMVAKEVLPVVARLCREDSSITEARPALLEFYEECDAEYTVLLRERLTAVRQAVKQWTGGFVEDAEVEEPPRHKNARLLTEGIGCENQHGIKRPFQVFMEETCASSEDSLSVGQYSDDVPPHATRPSSVCTGSTAGMEA
jgi:hypothetical protein